LIVPTSPESGKTSNVLTQGSVLYQLADTWFHNKTTSVLFTTKQPSVNSTAAGRDLSSSCKEYYKNYHYTNGSIEGVLQTGFAKSRVPCNVYVPDELWYITEPSQGYQLVSGPSASNNITTVNSSDNTRQYAVLIPSNISPNTDWTAKTVGVSVECALIGAKCGMGKKAISSASIPFNCSGTDVPLGEGASDRPAFQGSVFANYVSQILEPDGFNLPNPYVLGLATSIPGQLDTSELSNDPNIVPDVGQNGFVMMCTTSVWDLTYSSSNNSMTITDAKLSNLNTSQTVTAPVTMSTQSVQRFIESDLAVALFSSSTVNEMVSTFATSFSRLTLAFAASSFDHIPATSVFSSTTKIVACVSVAPLWALVGLAAAYILLSFVLTIIALHVSRVDNVRSAQAQLSVVGLTAAAFEDAPSSWPDGKAVRSAEELFWEYRNAEGAKLVKGKGRAVQRIGFGPNETRHWEFHVRKA
jgi:hypothetical protein